LKQQKKEKTHIQKTRRRPCNKKCSLLACSLSPVPGLVHILSPQFQQQHKTQHIETSKRLNEKQKKKKQNSTHTNACTKFFKNSNDDRDKQTNRKPQLRMQYQRRKAQANLGISCKH
jgi:predicted glycosyl hydrolase (DUF1957 family)